MPERSADNKQSAAVPTTAQKCNILSNILITPVPSTPFTIDGTGKGCSSVQQQVAQKGMDLPIIHLGSQELGDIPSEALDLLDDYERRAKYPKLENTTSVSTEKNTVATEAGVSNLGLKMEDFDDFRFNFTPVPALLSPLKDDDDFVANPATRPSSSSKGKSIIKKGRSLKGGSKNTKKNNVQKKEPPSLLKECLDRPKKSNKSATESKQPAQERNNADSKLSCFSQTAEQDTVTSFFNFYRAVKQQREEKLKAVQETEVELQRAKELVAQLEKKLKQYRSDLDIAEKKQREIEEEVKKTFNF